MTAIRTLRRRSRSRSRDVNTALMALSMEQPDWRIYSMGEYPRTRWGMRFFCGLERRTGGGRVCLGEGRILADAINHAVALAADDDRCRED